MKKLIILLFLFPLISFGNEKSPKLVEPNWRSDLTIISKDKDQDNSAVRGPSQSQKKTKQKKADQDQPEIWKFQAPEKVDLDSIN